MPDSSTIELLQPRLLAGVTMLLAGPAEGSPPNGRANSIGAAVHRGCAAVDADVRACPLPRDGSEEDVERAVDDALGPDDGVALLVVDCAGLFIDGTGGEAHGAVQSERDARAALIACVEATWNVTRVLANRAFLPAQRGGRIVYIAPPPSAGVHADAARAGVENLARTLSVEWARHRVTAVAIAPGEHTAADQLAALVAYLASPAGAYFSGCLLDLRGPDGGGGAARDTPRAAAV
jgi:NAD(P)-dependent dehydrogenase (short-subunit alcohol dehydrogenase family)